MPFGKDDHAHPGAPYHRRFETALPRRERRTDSASFWFRPDPGNREALETLARTESACCPFLDYRVELAGDELVWTTTDIAPGDEHAAIDDFLDATPRPSRPSRVPVQSWPDHTSQRTCE